LANSKVEIAKDMLSRWARDGISLVTNPYVVWVVCLYLWVGGWGVLARCKRKGGGGACVRACV
jgi:hypothetical protein